MVQSPDVCLSLALSPSPPRRAAWEAGLLSARLSQVRAGGSGQRRALLLLRSLPRGGCRSPPDPRCFPRHGEGGAGVRGCSRLCWHRRPRSHGAVRAGSGGCGGAAASLRSPGEGGREGEQPALPDPVALCFPLLARRIQLEAAVPAGHPPAAMSPRPKFCPCESSPCTALRPNQTKTSARQPLCALKTPKT